MAVKKLLLLAFCQNLRVPFVSFFALATKTDLIIGVLIILPSSVWLLPPKGDIPSQRAERNSEDAKEAFKAGKIVMVYKEEAPL